MTGKPLFDNGMQEPQTLLHVPPSAARLTIADPSTYSITICVGSGAVLAFKPDGTIEAGPAFAADNPATMEVFNILSRAAPSWMSAMRERAEKAEAELAEWKANPLAR